MSNHVHCVWVGNKPFENIQLLSIKQYQRLNFKVNLWLYNDIENIPSDVIVHDANEILPEESIFRFDRPHHFGNGSVSHWSDRFQLYLLKKIDGWYSQLDVTCLKIPKDSDYYFAQHDHTKINKTINTYIMKVPKDSPFIDNCITDLINKVNSSTMSKINWFDSMRIIGENVYRHNLSHHISYNNIECDPGNVPINNLEFIHWCNAGGWYKKHPFYLQLLEQHNLLK